MADECSLIIIDSDHSQDNDDYGYDKDASLNSIHPYGNGDIGSDTFQGTGAKA